MSILIPGMEMPTNCCQCPVNMEICKRGYKYLLEHPELYDKRADNCPLVPVPPHGDLIDRDAATEKIWDDMRFPSNLANAQFFVNELREMPTIIPADPAKEGEG